MAVERKEGRALIQLGEECTVETAAELKTLLVDCLADGEVQVDLTQVGQIDIAALQLLWAAGREAEHKGARLQIRWSDYASSVAHHAGLGLFVASSAEAR